MNQYIFVLEIVGTIAFAISGALVAMKSKMDFFGVVIIGVITATFGGIMRDIVLGSVPPSAFSNPVYVVVASITSVIVFLFAYFNVNTNKITQKNAYKNFLLIADAIGLGVFTAVGVRVAFFLHPTSHSFLLVFCGVLTGVGGGLFRDICVNQLPQIFHTDVYAIASIIGAIPCAMLMHTGNISLGIWIGIGVTIFVRAMAILHKWSLPVAKNIHD